MSDLLIVLALLATFGAIMLAGFALESALTQRRRAVDVLESQVSPVAPSTDLREMELQQPFLERALVPFLTGLGSVARRITPADMRRRIARKLVLAGAPTGWDAEKVAALKVFGTIGVGILGVGLSALAGVSPVLGLAA